jgi:branched-chain amino acid transport system permease protein
MLRLTRYILGSLVVVLFLGLPWLSLDAFWVQQIIFVTVFALLISSLNLQYGYAGELALGQVGVYAVCAYVSAYVGLHLTSDLIVIIPCSIAAAVLVGLISGLPGLRFGGWALAMVSFFLVVIVPNAADLMRGVTGGPDGLYGIPLPTLLGHTLSGNEFYLVAMVLLGAWLLALRNLVTSRHGPAFGVLRTSSILASSIGVSVYRMKLFAYVIGSVPVGLAAVIYTYQLQTLSPEVFTFTLAVSVIAGSILGGSLSVFGAIVGGVLLQVGGVELDRIQGYSTVIYGGLLIVGGLVFSQGVAGLVKSTWRRTRFSTVRGRLGPGPSAAGGAASSTAGTFTGASIEVHGVSRVFGGVAALDDVSLAAERGQITALIGTNGSGKTTLINAVTGFVRLDSGAVELDGVDITGRKAFQIARLGVARTFQTPIIPDGMTVREVVGASRFVAPRVGLVASLLRTPRYRRTVRDDSTSVDQALGWLGLGAHVNEIASELTLGTRRLVEVARALARTPSVLLLDEPAAGLEPREVDELVDVIKLVRQAGLTVVLIEHNFDLVRRVADQIYVLERGTLLYSGSANDVVRHPRVRETYFGGLADLLTTDSNAFSAQLEGPA